jgi:hypothetical protein
LNFKASNPYEYKFYKFYKKLVTLPDSQTGAVIPCVSMEPALYTLLTESTSNGGLGFGIKDFYQILSGDEYWNRAYNPITAIDGTRYTYEQPLKPFPYDSAVPPPPNCGTNCFWTCPTNEMQGIMNSQIMSGTDSKEYDYTSSLTVSAGTPVFLGAKATMTWTTTVSEQSTQSNSQGANLQVECASTAWGESLGQYTFLYVYPYFDSLFGTFLLVGADLTPPPYVYFSGRVVDSFGQPVQQMKLELSFANKTYDAFTDNDGNFQFYNYSGEDFSDPPMAQLSALGPDDIISETVSLGGATTVILPPTFQQQSY